MLNHLGFLLIVIFFYTMFLINNEIFLTLKFSNEKNDLFLNVNIEGFNFSQPFKVKWDLPFKFDPWPLRSCSTWEMWCPGQVWYRKDVLTYELTNNHIHWRHLWHALGEYHVQSIIDSPAFPTPEIWHVAYIENNRISWSSDLWSDETSLYTKFRTPPSV